MQVGDAHVTRIGTNRRPDAGQLSKKAARGLDAAYKGRAIGAAQSLAVGEDAGGGAGQREAAPAARLAAAELRGSHPHRAGTARGDEEHVREWDVGAEARVAERAEHLHAVRAATSTPTSPATCSRRT